MRLLTLPFRAVWAVIAATLRLLGFGTGIKPGCWQPPTTTDHPLWRTVQERREAGSAGLQTPEKHSVRTRQVRRAGGKALVFVIVVVGVSAVGAFASFSATGSGAGSANAGSSQALTISPGTPTSFLFPGGESDVKVSIDNPNGFAVTIPSLSSTTIR